jgi:hypothetical protein
MNRRTVLLGFLLCAVAACNSGGSGSKIPGSGGHGRGPTPESRTQSSAQREAAILSAGGAQSNGPISNFVGAGSSVSGTSTGGGMTIRHGPYFPNPSPSSNN